MISRKLEANGLLSTIEDATSFKEEGELKAYCTSFRCSGMAARLILKEGARGYYCKDCGHVLLWKMKKRKRPRGEECGINRRVKRKNSF